jgi:glycosyltransferase involved in cell wall biosynthesis
LKILLSAFACEPHQGSEPAVGWSWAVHLAEAGHDVTVLTRSCARRAIARELALPSAPSTLRVIYHDVPPAIRWSRRGGLHVHYILWQWTAAKFAKRLHITAQFERVHHVTFAGLRAPSFMGKLGIPFIFGPVGGGESAPWRLRRGYGLRGLLVDGLRDVANLAVKVELFMRRTFAQADKVYVTSRQTLRLVPRCYRGKTEIELAIAWDEHAPPTPPICQRDPPPDDVYRVLYVGRHIYFKGMYFGLHAFARLLRAYPNARLTMVGDGPQKRTWQRFAERLSLSANIDWLPWQTHAKTSVIYRRHDVLLFPSLHDSGGMVVLEAMAEGLPIVCLKIGGPGTMVNPSCGRAIDPAGKTVDGIKRELGEALIELADGRTRAALALAAREQCRNFSWQKKIARIYGEAVVT